MKLHRFPPTQGGFNRFLSIASQKLFFFFWWGYKLFLPPALRKGSDLEKAFATAALVYSNYADPESKLSKSETKSLLQSQFWHFIQVRGSAEWGALGQPWLGTLGAGMAAQALSCSLESVSPWSNSQ